MTMTHYDSTMTLYDQDNYDSRDSNDYHWLWTIDCGAD